MSRNSPGLLGRLVRGGWSLGDVGALCIACTEAERRGGPGDRRGGLRGGQRTASDTAREGGVGGTAGVQNLAFERAGKSWKTHRLKMVGFNVHREKITDRFVVDTLSTSMYEYDVENHS